MLYKLQEQGMEPRALQIRPELHEYLRFSWELFWELSPQRMLGDGFTGAIPVTEFLAHAALHSFTKAESVEYWRHVRVMDEAYRSFVQKRQKAEADKLKNSKGKP